MLKGKNAIITGANRGIGRATVEQFAANGANVWACARTYSELFETQMSQIASKYLVDIRPVYFDMADENQIKSAVTTIKKSDKKVDILVNIAGVADDSSGFTMSSIDDMRRIFEVNFWGTTILTQYVSRLMMRGNSGSIINISSVAGIDGTPAQYEYAASKAAINGAVKQLARELWKYGIRVNAIAPGIIDTDMGGQVPNDLLNETINRTVMKRLGRPEEVAKVAVFLAGDFSSYMTGQIIRVDGGM